MSVQMIGQPKGRAIIGSNVQRQNFVHRKSILYESLIFSDLTIA